MVSGACLESGSMSKYCPVCVGGSELASWANSLQRTGALGDRRRLSAADVEDADGGEVDASGEDKVVGKWQGCGKMRRKQKTR